MKIICKTKEELKKVLEKLENNGYSWRSGDSCVEWGMENINDFPVVIIIDKIVMWDDDIDDQKDRVTAAQFLGDADQNKEKEVKETGEILALKDKFDEAVTKALEAVTKALDEVSVDKDLNLQGKMLITMVGGAFAGHVKRLLFKEADE